MTHADVSRLEEFAQAPTAYVHPHARNDVRQLRSELDLRTLILDDDPTGSQAVHGLEVVTVTDPAIACAALRDGPAFVLTNSRSLDEADAVHLTATLIREVDEHLGNPGGLRIVSRSDSTLRGHVIAEVDVLMQERRRAGHAPYDGVLFAPAFFEAGRVTAGDTHWARVGGAFVGVGETEFAKDATFGYSTSHLPSLLAERGDGAVDVGDVLSIGLRDIREGGPERVARICRGARQGAWIVVNGLEYSDYDIVALGVLQAERDGFAFAVRCGPSFVRSILGIEPIEPVMPSGLAWRAAPTGTHGVVVVGSHTALTTAQLERLVVEHGAELIEVDVRGLLDDASRAQTIEAAVKATTASLRRAVTVIATSRDLVTGPDPQASLAIARRVSAGLSAVVRAVVPSAPAWVVAKGGITSHDLAVHGLGIVRAEVVGQVFPGQVSVFRPVEASSDCLGIPYVVFPGNVGDEAALAHVVARFEGAEAS